MPEDADADLTADARTVCDIVRTTLGPFGANKMVIQEAGNVSTTASGAKVLEKLDLDVPAVNLLTAAADDFRTRHGDGTTTFVTLTGALLEEATDLRHQGLHPTSIERGFRQALDVATSHVDRRSHPLSIAGPEAVARTALTGTRNPAVKQSVGDYLAQVAETVTSETGRSGRSNLVKVNARIGAQAETELIRGLVLDRDLVQADMPRSYQDAGIAVLSETLDMDTVAGITSRSETSASLNVESFEERAAVGERERESFREQLQEAVDAGCRFIVSQRAINERVERHLAQNGVGAIQNVDEEDIRRLVRATGATMVPNLRAVNEETLGRADVRVERKAGRDFVFIESDAGDSVYTLFCRAPDPRSVESFEESVEDALAAVLAATDDERVVPGGGAIEVDVANALREEARTIAGREQLAMNAFADALSRVPRTLATNAGMDGWEGVLRLRLAHDEGRATTGIDALAGEVSDMLEEDPVVEPTSQKQEVLSAATEMACHLLRIDEELPATDFEDEDQQLEPPEEGPVNPM